MESVERKSLVLEADIIMISQEFPVTSEYITKRNAVSYLNHSQ